MNKRACSGTTRSGDACKGNPLKGRDVCMAHADDETKASVSFGGAQAGGGRPKAPRAVDVLRERIERDIDKWLTPIEDALSAERTYILGTGEDAEAVSVPDHTTRMAAAREGLDRAYGKPKQATELSGPDGGPIPTQPVVVPDTEQYRRRVQQIAQRAMGTVATNGNGNGHS